MAKRKFKLNKEKKNPKERRIRSLNSNQKKFKQKTIKEENNLDQLKDIGNDEIRFEPKNRSFVLVGLVELVEKINQQFRLPDNFIFSTIALFDEYLNKTERYLSRKEMVKALYACLNLLDKEQNINIFNEFKKFYDCELEYEILEVIDLELYPKKMYDYFDKFYFDIRQKCQDKQLLIYYKEFKNIFLNYCFYILFQNDSFNKSPLDNFIFCLLCSYEKLRKINPIIDNCLDSYVQELVNKHIKSGEEHLDYKNLIDNSIYTFNYIYNELKNSQN